MWAQLVRSRLKSGKEVEMRLIQEEMGRGLRDTPGWIRTTTFQNQADPQEYFALIQFDSEAQAREREGSSRQQEFTRRIRECMEGPSDYINLNFVSTISK